MADETSQAVFTDVLNITASPKTFAESLDLLLAEYNKFLEKLGTAGQSTVAASGLGKQIADSFEYIEASISKIAIALEKFVDANSVASQKVIAENKEVIKSIEEVSAAKEGSSRGIKLARDIDIEQEGIVNKTIADEEKIDKVREQSKERQLQFAKEIEIEQEGIVNKELANLEKLNEEQLKTAERQLQLAREIALEQEGITNSQSERQEALALRQLKLAEEIALEQEGIAQRASDRNTIIAERQIQVARTIAIEQEGIVNKTAQSNSSSLIKLNEQLASANSKITEAQNRLDVVSPKAQEKLSVLQSQIERIKTDISFINNNPLQGPSILNDTITDKEQTAALLSKQVQLTGQLNSVQKELDSTNKSFLDRFNGGLVQSAAHLLRITLLFEAIGTAIEIVKTAIVAPFKTIQDGIKYLQDAERAAAELAVPLEANVEFSKDFATNMRLSQEAAKELIPLLQTKSLQSGLPLQQLENVFKALTGSGASQGVKTVKDLATFSEAFAIVLEASGRNALAINGEIAKLSQLFSGVNTKSSLFLQTLHISTEEWEKILEASKEHGNLIELLAPKINPYLDAAHQVGKTQLVLTEQLDLLIKQLEGAGSAKFFEYLNELIKETSDFFKSHEPEIIRGIQLFADWIIEFGKLLQEFLKLPGIQPAIIGFFGAIGIVLDFTRNALVVTIAALEALYKGMAQPFSPSKDNILDTFNKKLDESGKKTKEFYDILNGGKDKSLQASSNNPFGIKDALTTPIVGKPGPDLTKSTSGLVKSQFELEAQRYKNTVEDIRKSGEKLKDSTLEQVAAREISYEQASDIIEGALAKERVAVEAATVAFSKAAAARRAEIAGDNKLDKPTKDLALLNFDKQLEETTRAQEAAEAEMHKVSISFLTKAEREKAQVKDINFKADLQRQKEQNAQTLAIENALYNAGYITQVEFLDRKAKANADAFALETEIADTEIAREANDPVKKAVALNKKLEIEQKYTNSVKQLAFERIEAQRKEDLALETFGDASRALTNEQLRIQQELSTLLVGDGGFSKTQQELLDIQLREIEILRSEKLAQLEVSIAKNDNTQNTKNLILAVQQLDNAEKAAFNNRIKQIQQQVTTPAFRETLTGAAISDERNKLLSNRDETLSASKQLADRLRDAGVGNTGVLLTKEVEDLVTKLKVLGFETDNASKDLKDFDDSTKENKAKALGKFVDQFLGAGFTASLRAVNDQLLKNKNINGQVLTSQERHVLELEKASVVTAGLSNAFVLAANALSTIKSGFQQGGVLGAAGAAAGIGGGILTSLKGITGVASAIPVVGTIVSALGPVLSIIGGLFTAAAKRIGQEVKKNFDDTITAFQDGKTNLVNTITALQNQRAEAIARLSGKKGGQDQLNTLLPEFDQEIKQLQKQQADITTNFETQLGFLKLQDDALAGIEKQWADINKQVLDYIGAGGDAAKAAEFLSLSLKGIQDAANKELADGQKQAIDDAINLNSLLEQRNKLNEDFTNQLFDLQNADSLERKQSGVETRAQQIKDLKDQHQKDLDDLNSQIDLATQKVNKEKEVFDIVKTTAQLQADSNALTLASLDEQITKWKDLQSIVNSITLGPNGYVGTGPVAPQINLTINASGDPNAIAKAAGDAVTEALTTAQRQGSPY